MERLALVLVGCSVLACAPSRRAANCDPSTPDCLAIDAGIDAATPDAPPDAMLRHFGDPCTNAAQCDSDVCLLVGTGGVCTQVCDGTCPDGYGCFGVIGAIDPGQIALVCVPISSQLCSPCQADTECTLLGMDKCVIEPTGRHYCARDCSTVACPTGYDCMNQVIDSVNYKQCVPHSQACDCMTAAQIGTTDACTITTGLGTSCAGTRTCTDPTGPMGWSACAPPTTVDDPDGMYRDDNCDGIDGDVARGIFVSGAGVDGASCGRTPATPCKTISTAIVRAVQAAKQNVYIQAGDYNEVVVLQSGINLWGGYDIGWQRGPYSDAAHRVTVVGKQDTGTGGDGEYLTIRARDLVVPVTIGDVVLQGPAALGVGGASGRDGRSSYVVHAKAAQVNLVRVQIVAGSGAPGGTGSAGTDAPMVDAQSSMFGGTGGNGNQSGQLCEDTTAGAGGAAGINHTACAGPSSRPTIGGAGGRGGPKDNNCPTDLDAKHGANGLDADFTFPPSFGVAGLGGTGKSDCGATTPGHDGLFANGVGGTSNAGGYLGGASNLYWYARGGNAGGTGENGTGGGGGGGAGGCDKGTDAWGAGGGGGGAGGCAARGGGGGGGGGGGAFGIAAFAGSAISLDSCTLFRGVAGTGGTGGSGGRGQSGGGGGQPGLRAGAGATAGVGGNGKHGGHGGGGGGGQGGRSFGILSSPDSTISGTCSQSLGSAGGSGPGGASAPGAPAGDADGNPGAPGPAGTLGDALQCSGSC